MSIIHNMSFNGKLRFKFVGKCLAEGSICPFLRARIVAHFYVYNPFARCFIAGHSSGGVPRLDYLNRHCIFHLLHSITIKMHIRQVLLVLGAIAAVNAASFLSIRSNGLHSLNQRSCDNDSNCCTTDADCYLSCKS